MSPVLDCSATMARVFPDERTQAISEIFDAIPREGAWVPDLWRIEVLNSLNIAIKRGRIDKEERRSILEDLNSLPIEFDSATDQYCWNRTLALADRHRLTV